nr:hypothetical protein [uncultured Vibrio sp.]
MKSQNKRVMLYKPGGTTRVWNTTAHTLVVDEADVDSYLEEGWLDHPSKLFEETKKPEPVAPVLKTAEELAALKVSDLDDELSALPYTADVIAAARAIEVDGKNRTSALEVYDGALE